MSLADLVGGTIPEKWTISQIAAEPVFIFDFLDANGERQGGVAFEVQPHGVYFIGLEAGDGAGVFRGLCKVLPPWAREQGITTFVVPLAQSEQMQQLLTEAGFKRVHGPHFEADVSEENCALELYGQSRD
jgi:hypothetical protein